MCLPTQKLRPVPRPVAYFSKHLDMVAEGWPGCLQAVAVTAHGVGEASILTLGKHLDVTIPQQVQGV